MLVSWQTMTPPPLEIYKYGRLLVSDPPPHPTLLRQTAQVEPNSDPPIINVDDRRRASMLDIPALTMLTKYVQPLRDTHNNQHILLVIWKTMIPPAGSNIVKQRSPSPRAGSDRIGSDRTGSNRIVLDQTELDRIRLDQIRPDRISFYMELTFFYQQY